MRLALVAHGFPPRENAGTEQYTARVATALRARGAEVRVVVSAPRPGASMYAVEDDGRVMRITNNAPYAGLRHAHADRTLADIVAKALAAFRPDVVHVQHLHAHALPARWTAPTVWTLHDAWGWCAAGGQLLRHDETSGAPVPCDGPGADCADCASRWTRDPPAVTAALRAAGTLGRIVPPERLHAAWKRVPATLRDRVNRSRPAPVTTDQLAARDRAIRAFARGCAACLAPSAWLADTAARNGIGRVDVLPHGVDPAGLPRGGDGPFVFLGTLAWHKGPDLVVEAHRRAGVSRPLALYGPAGPDAAYAARFRARALDPVEVPRVLADARALVMGSRWPENAPLVALEARAAGCPVIAPRIGGLPELVAHERDGLLYAPGDPDALADAIRRLEARAMRPSAPPTFGAHLDALTTVYTRAITEGR
jgi:glycosyltransferase involved in cell wall biosynthesis